MKIRDRIQELRRVKASELKRNPHNWRKHTEAQRDALRGVLAEIGYAAALVARELKDGTLELIDGELRADETPDQEVPVLILDVTAEEADTLLATMDPIGRMAETNQTILDELLDTTRAKDPAVQQLLDQLASDDLPVRLQQLETKPPPEMSWVLIGIPTVRFGEIARHIEALSAIEGITLETTVTDEPKPKRPARRKNRQRRSRRQA